MGLTAVERNYVIGQIIARAYADAVDRAERSRGWGARPTVFEVKHSFKKEFERASKESVAALVIFDPATAPTPPDKH